MKWSKTYMPAFVLGALVLVFGLGCSSDSPSGPAGGAANALSPYTQNTLITGESFQVSGRVETIDLSAQQLTLVGMGYLVTADDGCEVTFIEQGIEIPITFADINIGDSVQVCGTLQENDNVLARRIRAYSEVICDPYDLAFGGTIATIDHAGGSFTVAERGETILTDENTIIWAQVVHASDRQGKIVVTQTQDPNQGHFRFIHDTVLVFSDLKVGDWVEVKANIVDENTLLAVKIKLASDCVEKCVTFTDQLATIDVDTRTVTFAVESWTGLVCPNALLAEADGTPLTLADFSPTDLVAVKGFPIDDESFKICVMIRQ